MTNHKIDYIEIEYGCCASSQSQSLKLSKDITSTYTCSCGKITKIVAFDNSSLYKKLIDYNVDTISGFHSTFNESDNTLKYVKKIPSIDRVYKFNGYELWILLNVITANKKESKNSDVDPDCGVLVFIVLLLFIFLCCMVYSFCSELFEVHPPTFPYCVYRHLGDDQGELHPASYGDCQFQSEFIAEFLPVCSISKFDADGKRVTTYANRNSCKFHERDSIFIKKDMEKLTYRTKNIPYCVYNLHGYTHPAALGDCQFKDELYFPFLPVCSILNTYEDQESSITSANRQDCKFHEEDSEILNRYKR